MQRKLHQYNLHATLAKKHSHTTYLASPINNPEHQVTLTVFASSLLRTPHELENFLQKARHIKELQHPHLVPILDIGVEEEQPFIVRKYLPNGSLRSRIQQISPDHLELKEALTIVSHVGKALTYAHEYNIVHGNIKPENILFGANNQICLADFHLVTRTDAIIRDQASDEYAFCYLAPEQFTSKCDARSDQYALGCIAYELITGRVPFVTQSLASMMQTSLPLQALTQETTLPPFQRSATTTNMSVAFYSWTDNSPPGANIAYPETHSSAGGVGTDSNPITFGTSVNELSPGTIIYVQDFKKYFIMEDECSACDSDWKNYHRYEIVLWIGGDANSSNRAIQSCEGRLTPPSSVPVVVQPSTNLTVDTTPLFTDSGGCIKL